MVKRFGPSTHLGRPNLPRAADRTRPRCCFEAEAEVRRPGQLTADTAASASREQRGCVSLGCNSYCRDSSIPAAIGRSIRCAETTPLPRSRSLTLRACSSSAATASQEPLETLASIVTAGVRISLRSSLLVLSASALCVAGQAALSSRAERCGWVSRTLELGPISAVMTRSMPSARACASAARVALAACRDQGNHRQNPGRADTATALSSSPGRATEQPR
jgi:hypothetical protein